MEYYDDAIRKLLDDLVWLPNDAVTIKVEYESSNGASLLNYIEVRDNLSCLVSYGAGREDVFLDFIDQVRPHWRDPGSNGTIAIDLDTGEIHIRHMQVVLQPDDDLLRFPDIAEEKEEELNCCLSCGASDCEGECIIMNVCQLCFDETCDGTCSIW